MHFEFTAKIWFWRGPAPWHFVTVPEEFALQINAVSKTVTYGWGMIPVDVRIGKSKWYTALWPKDGGYIVPIKTNIRKAEKIQVGDQVTVRLDVRF
jgi:hypothetical protein